MEGIVLLEHTQSKVLLAHSAHIHRVGFVNVLPRIRSAGTKLRF